jgi:hypothetical protein
MAVEGRKDERRRAASGRKVQLFIESLSAEEKSS